MSASTPPPTPRPAPPVTDPGTLGRLRRLDRCATPEGLLAIAAIDHPARLLGPADGPTPSRETVVHRKLALVTALAPHASGFLLDPELSIAEAAVSGALPGGSGMIANIEQLRESDTGFEREVDLRPGWDPARIAASGADGVKFVFFHRAELPEAEREVERVTALIADCHAVGLPCVIEPLWYPHVGEDPADPTVARSRARAIVAEAARFAACGADVLKVQFPGGVADPGQRAEARAACRELDAALPVPWVLLSEAVGYDDFRVQVELAATEGSSGFMAGRAVWSEVAASGGSSAAIALAVDRLATLRAVVDACGRPWRERVPGDALGPAVADGWWSRDG